MYIRSYMLEDPYEQIQVPGGLNTVSSTVQSNLYFQSSDGCSSQ